MVGRTQRDNKQRRFIVNLTGTEVEDAMWAMEQGAEQMGYVDSEGDYELSESQWQERQERVWAAIRKLTDAFNDGGEVWP